MFSKRLLLVRQGFKLYYPAASALRRGFGGYIEDAQLAMLGKDVWHEINGEAVEVPVGYVVPNESPDWPSNLWGYELGVAVSKHLGVKGQK
jgi:hypothetical protein